MKRLRVGPYDTTREEAAKDGEHLLVWATSRDCPNKSPKARGRVLHIERVDDKFDCPATFCGMMAVEYADKQYPRTICIQCQNIKAKETKSNQPCGVTDLEAQYFRRILDLESERDRLRAQNEELVKALKGIVDSEASCHRCEGDGHLWADGKSHYATYKGPTVSCASCGGSGISYEDGIEIAQRALKSSESDK